MHKFLLILTLGWTAVSFGSGRTTETLSLTPRVFLPDGSEFTTWENRTVFTKTFFVDQNHPDASDGNAGTEDKPFLTINRAAIALEPGQRVVIKSGIYREQIIPLRGGTGPDRMIGYEAAPGARVVIKGSKILRPEWTRSRNPGESSQSLWMIALSPDYFERENPFRILNADSSDLDIMPWAHEWTGKFPFALRRGMVFQDGNRLTQLAEYADLSRVPGSFWVEPTGTTVHIHPQGGKNPNRSVMEITVRQHLMEPAAADLGYIRVAGLTFMHAGNGFPRTGVGAVFTRGGHHWIIENNTVCEVNSVGIEIGTRSIESANESIGKRDEERARRNPGCMIVRNNRVFECGRGGIQGLEVRRALVEGNWIHDCGWQDAERLWETGAIKLLVNERTLVWKNRIEHVTGGPAVWLDWNNRYCRVTRNIVFDTESCCNGALFVEASRKPNMIDHNVLLDVRGTGILAGDTDSLIVAHNLVGPCAGPAVRSTILTDRELDGRRMTSRGNRVFNNILLADQPVVFADSANASDCNVFGKRSASFNLADWRKTGWDHHSFQVSAECGYDPGTAEIFWSSDTLLPLVPRIRHCDFEYHGTPTEGDLAVPGPFKDRFSKAVTLNAAP
jgi:alpha-L-arabinofuranosidase